MEKIAKKEAHVGSSEELEMVVNLNSRGLKDVLYNPFLSRFTRGGKEFSNEEAHLFMTGSDLIETSRGSYRKIYDCAKIRKSGDLLIPERILRYVHESD